MTPLYIELARTRGAEYAINYDTGCWEWLGARDKHGYGRTRQRTPNACSLAHRLLWERHHGVKPPDTLDHLCRVRFCVNPGHLEPVSRGENVRRGANAKVTWAIVDEIRQSTEPNPVVAERFGVAPCTISQIRREHTWKPEHRPEGV